MFNLVTFDRKSDAVCSDLHREKRRIKNRKNSGVSAIFRLSLTRPEDAVYGSVRLSHTKQTKERKPGARRSRGKTAPKLGFTSKRLTFSSG